MGQHRGGQSKHSDSWAPLPDLRGQPQACGCHPSYLYGQAPLSPGAVRGPPAFLSCLLLSRSLDCGGPTQGWSLVGGMVTARTLEAGPARPCLLLTGLFLLGPCVLQPRPPCSPAETSPPPWSPPNLSLPFPLGPQASLLTVPGSGNGTACGQACDMSWIFSLGWTFRLETSQSHCLFGRESVCPRLPGAGCGGSGSRAGSTQKRQLY